MEQIDVAVSNEMSETILEVVEYGDQSANEIVCEALDQWARGRDLKELAKQALIAAVRIGYESGESLEPEAVFTGPRGMPRVRPFPDCGPTQLRFSPAAIADLLAIKLQVAANYPDREAEILAEFESFARQVADQPSRFERYNDICLGLFEAHFRGYVMFFNVLRSGEVRIERVIRGARDFMQTSRLSSNSL